MLVKRPLGAGCCHRPWVPALAELPEGVDNEQYTRKPSRIQGKECGQTRSVVGIGHWCGGGCRTGPRSLAEA